MTNTTHENLDQELKLADLNEVSGGLRFRGFRPQQKLQRRVMRKASIGLFGSRPVDRPMCW